MEKTYKKIIILGNGFDLFLDLPTRWSDFINFYNIIKEIEPSKIFDNKNNNKDFDISTLKEWTNENINICILKIYEHQGNNEKYKNDIIEFLNNIKVCKMLAFCSSMGINKNWNNFEHLIEDLLNYIDEYVDNIVSKPHDGDNSEFMNKNLEKLIECLEYNEGKYFKKCTLISDINLKTDVESDKEKFLKKYFDEILNFTNCYKQYINLIIDWIIDIQKNGKQIKITEETLLLNFNYTQDTIYFDSFFGKALHIHGQARDNNNIIIGISNEQRKIDRIKFSKEYIRIHNRVFNKNVLTDNIYKELELESNNFNHYYIIGHSLDVVDHSLLILLYSKKLIKTTIFFYSNEDKADKLFNLYLLLKEEKMNRLLNDNLLEFKDIKGIWEYNFLDE